MKISKFVRIFIVLGLLTLSAAACELPFSPPSTLDVVQQLAQTQMALSAMQTSLAPVPTETAPPATAEPTQDISQTQDAPAAGTTRYTFGHFQFDMPDYLAQSLNYTIVPAAMGGEESFPGDTHPEYLSITFNGYIIRDAFHNPEIQVYPVAEFKSISQGAADKLDTLNNLLGSRPPSIPFNMALPFLPFWNAGQVFNAQAKFLDSPSGSGIRYISMYAQAVYPVDNYNIFFTYQGFSADKTYFVSMVLPINSAALPMEAATPADFDAFMNDFSNYLQTTSAALNAEAPDRFTPSLNALDAMIASFRFNP